MTYWLSLGKTISMEGRRVTSFPALFGYVTGLNDFISFLIVLVIGSSQAKAYHYN